MYLYLLTAKYCKREKVGNILHLYLHSGYDRDAGCVVCPLGYCPVVGYGESLIDRNLMIVDHYRLVGWLVYHHGHALSHSAPWCYVCVQSLIWPSGVVDS